MNTHSFQRRFVLGLMAIALMASAGPVRADITNGVDPGYVKVKVYEVRVAQASDCSGPSTTVFRESSPSYVDWNNGPTLGSGAIPNGTYNCIMLKMSDNIHYTPTTAHASWSHSACEVGTDYVLDVGHDENAMDPEGVTQSLGTRGTDNTVWLYIHRGANSDLSTWVPSGGLELTSPLVVTGDRANTMVFDFSNKIGEEEVGFGLWQCGCDPPTMGFR